MRRTIDDLVREAAALHPGRPALTLKDRTVTYAETLARVESVAAGLERLGVPRGGRVAVFLDKRPETVFALFGAAACGAVFVPVNPVLKARQVAHILRDGGAHTLITTPQRLDMLRDELSSCPELVELVLLAADTGPPVDGIRSTTWDALDAGGTPRRGAGIDLDLAAILYTSGSTGSPKGVVVSHRNLIAGAESVSSYLQNTCDDVLLAALPLSFDAGLSQITTAFAVGAHVVLLNYVLAADAVRACAQHGVTGLTCVPPLWAQLAEREWPPEASGSLRYFANTGGRLPRATLDRLRAIFPGAAPYLMYGLTEAFRSTYLDPAEIDHRPGSIGKAIPNAEVLVLRPDGTECDPGEPGELVHRGALVALGYWNDPGRTAERFRPIPGADGDWRAPERAVWSGDVVVRDDDGFLSFVGRDDDMIKTSGYRVSPTEVEEAAYAVPGVHAAVAFGVPDERLGQRIVLVVAGGEGDAPQEQVVLAALRKDLPLFMVPAVVTVLPEIPRSPNGKLDRTWVREEVGA